MRLFKYGILILVVMFNSSTLVFCEDPAITHWEIGEEIYKGGRHHGVAMFYYRHSADMGYGPAMEKMGYLYRKGLGAPVDNVASLEWYKKAAAAGQVGAMKWLATVYEDGLMDVAVDMSMAEHWYTILGQKGEWKASQWAGHGFYNAQEGQRDINKAYGYFNQAASGSDDPTYYALKIIQCLQLLGRDKEAGIYHHKIMQEYDDVDAWKSNVMNYQMGKISRSDFVDIINKTDDKNTKMRYYYYLGSKMMVENDFEGAQDYLEKCTALKPEVADSDYESAIAELRRIPLRRVIAEKEARDKAIEEKRILDEKAAQEKKLADAIAGNVGIVKSVNNGEQATININAGSDVGLEKGGSVIIKREGAIIAKAKLVRVGISRSIAEIVKDDSSSDGNPEIVVGDYVFPVK